MHEELLKYCQETLKDIVSLPRYLLRRVKPEELKYNIPTFHVSAFFDIDEYFGVKNKEYFAIQKLRQSIINHENKMFIGMLDLCEKIQYITTQDIENYAYDNIMNGSHYCMYTGSLTSKALIEKVKGIFYIKEHNTFHYLKKDHFYFFNKIDLGNILFKQELTIAPSDNPKDIKIGWVIWEEIGMSIINTNVKIFTPEENEEMVVEEVISELNESPSLFEQINKKISEEFSYKFIQID